MADAIIAGLASANNLHIVTRNVRHFLPFRVAASSPHELAAGA
jgi:predicted nucleic acid-binding protein